MIATASFTGLVLLISASATILSHSSSATIHSSSSPPSVFEWPVQWSAVQEISIVSGNFTGAVQRGRIAYDFTNGRTREDQVLIRGPSVKTPETSNNMTEWFHGTTWYYMDWTTGVCQTADFGIGMVKPDWLVDPNDGFPRRNGSTFIFAVDEDDKRRYVNTSYIWVDGSAGFGEPPRSSEFEYVLRVVTLQRSVPTTNYSLRLNRYYVDAIGNGRRMRMPSTLSADLVVDLKGFKRQVDPSWFDLPDACEKSARRVDPPSLSMTTMQAIRASRRLY